MSERKRAFIPYAHGIGFWCPGCNNAHCMTVKQWTPNGWEWNGDWKKATFSPSIGVSHSANGGFECHSFVRDGQIQFLADCQHALAGKTVPVPVHEWPQWVLDEAKERGKDWPPE